jgi:hypothetical protein
MQKCLKEHISCNLEVYVDDTVVKNKMVSNLTEDLEDLFQPPPE